MNNKLLLGMGMGHLIAGTMAHYGIITLSPGQQILSGIFDVIAWGIWFLLTPSKKPTNINELSVSMVTRGGRTPVITKRDTRFRHSSRNTVIGFILFHEGKHIGFVPNEAKK